MTDQNSPQRYVYRFGGGVAEGGTGDKALLGGKGANLAEMASIGLPGTSGFVGEFLALAGTYQASTWAALICTTGIILGAAYMLYLYRRVAFGDQINADAAAMSDVDKRELWLLAPLAGVALWMGVYPESFLAPIRKDVSVLVERLDSAKPASDSNIIENAPWTQRYRVAGEVSHEEVPAAGEAH